MRKRIVLNSVLGATLVATGVGGWMVVRDDSASAGATRTVVTATLGTVSSTVSGTGNVTAPSSYALNFASAASANTVTAIGVKVGDRVAAGQTLATVDSTTLQTAVQVAQAQLMSAQAALAKLQGGLSEADAAQLSAQETQSANQLSSAKDAVTQAQNNFDNDTTTLDAAIDQAQANLDAAKAKQAADATTLQSQLNQTQATLAADQQRLTLAQSAVSVASDDQRAALQQDVDAAQALVVKDQAAVLAAQTQASATDLSDEQAVNAAQNALTNAQTNKTAKLASDTQAIAAAERQVTAAQASYDATLAANDVKRAAASDADVATAQAQVATAQNGVNTAQKNLDAATLTAPVAGTITALTGSVGSAASSSASSNSSTSSTSATGATGSTGATSSSSSAAFLTLIDFDSLEVKVGFTEADAGKVKAGQPATVSFDSLTNTRLTGTVRAIDITGTTVSNVVTYYGYITLANLPTDGSVKPEMTASVSVVTESVDNVISVPTAAVSSRGTSGTVNVQIGSDPTKTTPTEVQIGLRGDSAVQITSGLKEGDKVVIVVNRTGSTSAATSAVGTTGLGGTGTGGRTPTGGFGGGPGGP